jgi:TldD protein
MDDQKNPTRLNRRSFLGMGAAVTAGGILLPSCQSPRSGAATARRAGTSNPVTKSASATLEEFRVKDSDLRKVMARALQSGGDFCDLFFQRRNTNRLGLEDEAVNSASSKAELGVGVRVVRGVETGYAYTESLDLDSMLKAAEVAAAVANGTPRKDPESFSVGKTASYYPIEAKWGGVAVAQKVSLLSNYHKLIAKHDPRIKKISINYTDEESTIVVVDSLGRQFSDYQPMTTCYAHCVAEHKGRREANYSGVAGRSGFEFYTQERLEAAAKLVVDRTIVLFDAVAGPVGELPVVLGPGSSGILLHEAIGHGMEADFARRKTTIYTDKVNQKIANDFVTIVDDGTQRNSRGSINIDDEGNSSQRTVLVENGTLRTFMHDRISAKHFGLKPTGNGRRQSFRHMPVPRMRNTCMLAGPHQREEIIASVKKGIYAEHFTNGQVDIGGGDYTFYIKNGMLIEDGKLTRPIKDVNIIGNGPESLRRVNMVGKDYRLDDGGWTCGKRGQRVPVGLGMPTVKISAVTVGGTKKG